MYVYSSETSIDMIQLTSESLNQDVIIKYVSDPSAGALSLFIGE